MPDKPARPMTDPQKTLVAETPRRQMKPEDAPRFWSKVRIADDPDACFEWTASKKGHYGYGGFWSAGRHWPTHRYAWFLEHGQIPDGMSVCHRCDNPKCVNVRHLFLGTHADNMRDALRKGRFGKQPPPGKHLSADQVAEVARLLRSGLSMKEVARRVGTGDMTVRRLGKYLGLRTPTKRQGIKPPRSYGQCGIRNGQAKLTPEAVAEIRSSGEPHTVLARRFGVDPMTIARARRGEHWRTV